MILSSSTNLINFLKMSSQRKHTFQTHNENLVKLKNSSANKSVNQLLVKCRPTVSQQIPVTDKTVNRQSADKFIGELFFNFTKNMAGKTRQRDRKTEIDGQSINYMQSVFFFI